MTMHKPSTSPSNANTAEKGAPILARLPGKLGSNAREMLLCHNQTAHSEWGNFCVHKLWKTEREYWCAAAPTLTRAGCKSVENLPKSSKKRWTTFDRLLRRAFRHAKLLSCYKLTLGVLWWQKFTAQASLCHTGTPTDAFAFFKAPGDWYNEHCLGMLCNVKISFFLAHSCCNLPSENNVITKVAEWKRPQVSF